MASSERGLTWQVNLAVRHSLTLPAPSRLIMLVLSDIADAGTAETPPQRTPSLAELAAETGLGIATVKRHLALLEAEGWIERKAPTDAQRVRRVRTQYRLLVPQGSQRAESSHAGPTVSPDTAHPDTEQGSQRATNTAHSGPSFNALSDGSDEQDVKPQPPRTRGSGRRESAKPDTEPDPDTAARDKLAREVLAWWWEQLSPRPAGKQAWHASLRVINNLLSVGHEAKAVAAAARTIGTPLTVPRMEIELGRMRTAAAATNGHFPRPGDDLGGDAHMQRFLARRAAARADTERNLL